MGDITEIVPELHSVVTEDPLMVLFYFLNKFIYIMFLLLAVLGFRCCMRAFSSCGKRGLLFVVVHGPLVAVASLVAKHRLWARGLQ